ncbi:allantoate permease [Myriangium duriaei CBS 260.36]|uniref:Allantoate permease n=1 Tax=Myriangium duriaei CBS 260.36 TaxID=1168546 RepID=A0A9P4MCL1_9PEZI|nr:allantoate permease [Myriangium duriaei CBS 260.36]
MATNGESDAQLTALPTEHPATAPPRDIPLSETATKEVDTTLADDVRRSDSTTKDGAHKHAEEAVVPKDADQAYEFLHSADVDNSSDTSFVDLARLRRRIDWRLVPFLWLCYTMCWLDKSIINYANVMGLTQQLKLKGNEFSDSVTFFYTALTLAEIPTGFILNKVPAQKWLAINVILWGISTACVAAAKGYHSLLAARIFVAIFEAAVAPCLLLMVSQWYTKSEQATRFALWYTGLGVGQIIGGIQSYGFLHVHHPSFSGWRIMFVVMGCITVVVGFFTLFFVPETPMKAKYLANHEKAALLRHIAANRTGVSNTRFVAAQVIELLLDIQIWWLMAITCSVAITSGVIASYSSTLLKNFGYSAYNSALLNAISGVVSIFAALASGYGVRKFGNRWAFIIAVILPSILGGALMTFMPRKHKSSILAGIYLVNTCTATLPIIYQWTAANIAGHTKRPVAMGFVTAAFGIASLIGPQTFRAKDAPLYQPARLTVLITLCFSAALTAGLAGYYTFENKRRDREGAQGEGKAEDELMWGNLTDKQNPAFRYVI